jgi:hypothetical protein
VGLASNSSRVIASTASSSSRSKLSPLDIVYSRVADSVTGSIFSLPDRQHTAGTTALPRSGHIHAHGRPIPGSAQAPPAHNVAESSLGGSIATLSPQKQPRSGAVGVLRHTGRNIQKAYSIAARSICLSRLAGVGPTRSWTGSEKGRRSGPAPVTHIQGLGKGNTGTSGNAFIPGLETRRMPERSTGWLPDGIPLNHGHLFSDGETTKMNARREHGSPGGSIGQGWPLLAHVTPAPAMGRLGRTATESTTAAKAADGRTQPPSARAPCASASAPEGRSSSFLSEDEVSYLANKVYGLITDSVRREKELNGH